jgi:hypothetical protein
VYEDDGHSIEASFSANLFWSTSRRSLTDVAVRASVACTPVRPLDRNLLSPLVDHLSAALVSRLEQHMRPPISSFLTVPLFQLAGVVAMRATKTLGWANRSESDVPVVYADAIEAAIAEMYAHILHLERVRPEDAAARLFGRIRRELGVNLSLMVLFKASSVRKLADLVRVSRQNQEPVSRLVPADRPLKYAQ